MEMCKNKTNENLISIRNFHTNYHNINSFIELYEVFFFFLKKNSNKTIQNFSDSINIWKL